MKSQSLAIKLPHMSNEFFLPPAAEIMLEAMAILEQQYPARPLTLSGPLGDSIAEIVAAEAFDLKLVPPTQKKRDVTDRDGRAVIVKLANGDFADLSGLCDRLIVLRILNPKTAELIYDGCGKTAWYQAGKTRKDGSRGIALSKLQSLGKTK